MVKVNDVKTTSVSFGENLMLELKVYGATASWNCTEWCENYGQTIGLLWFLSDRLLWDMSAAFALKSFEFKKKVDRLMDASLGFLECRSNGI